MLGAAVHVGRRIVAGDFDGTGGSLRGVCGKGPEKSRQESHKYVKKKQKKSCRLQNSTILAYV